MAKTLSIKKLGISLLLAISFTTPIILCAGCLTTNCKGGYGIRTYSNGNKYEGIFDIKGLPEGIGIMTHKAGYKEIGIWENGNFKQEEDILGDLQKVRLIYRNKLGEIDRKALNNSAQDEIYTDTHNAKKNKHTPSKWDLGIKEILTIISIFLGIIYTYYKIVHKRILIERDRKKKIKKTSK